MESSGECMINDAALTTPAEDSCRSGVTFRSDEMRRVRGHEFNMKRQR